MSGASARLPWVDFARGLALWAMLVFHLVWDLAQFGWIDSEAPYTPFMRGFGDLIAASFLLLVGYSLVLAAQAKGPLWRSEKFWRRWGQIALAAAAISAASFWLFPETPIFFGILHCIAVALPMALPFIGAPPFVTLGFGALALSAPQFFRSPLFDGRIFWWTGLGTFLPPSNDYRPLLPWLAFVLFGVALGRWTNPRPLSRRHCDERSDEAIQESQPGSGLLRHSPSKTGVFRRPMARNDGWVARALTFCGRHSLAFYLIHQPLLFGFFTLLGLVAAPTPDARLFLRQCAVQCVNAGVEAGICEKSCACVVDRAKAAKLWSGLARDRLTAPEKSVIHDAAVACYADAAGK